jgi:hypothetical protein
MKPEGLKAFSYKTDAKSEIYSHEKKSSEFDLHYVKQFMQITQIYEIFFGYDGEREK